MKKCMLALLLLLTMVPAAAEIAPYANYPGFLTDNLGFRWDIHPNGMLADGTNDLFDGGLQLHINNQQFPGRQLMLDSVTKEIVCGPVATGNVQVTRRILIDAEQGLGRWLEVLENPTDQAVTVQVKIFSDLGAGCRATEGYQPGQREQVGWLTISQDQPRPVIGLALFDPSLRREVEVQAQVGNGQVYWLYQNVKIPAHGVVVLCHFIVQRHDPAAARDAVNKLRAAVRLRNLDRRLLRALYNFRGSEETELELRVERRADADVVTTEADDELIGTMALPTVQVPTALGRFTVAGRDVVAIQPAPEGEPGMEVITRNGEVLRTARGRALGGRPATFTLEGGLRINVPVEQIRSFARQYDRASSAIRVQYPRVILASGDQLVIEPQFSMVKVQTPYGALDLPLPGMQSVVLRDELTGQPAVRLRDGSRFEGFLQLEQLAVKLRQGRRQQLPVETIVALQCSAALTTQVQEPYATMTNGDILCGSPTDDPLRVASTFGRVAVPREQVATIAAVPDAPLLLEICMLDGSRLKTRLQGDRLPFTLTGGQRVMLAAGHLRELKLRPVRIRVESVTQEEEAGDDGEADADMVAGGAEAAVDLARLAADLVICEPFDASVRAARQPRRASFVAGRYGQALAIPRGQRLTFKVPPDFLRASTVMGNVRVDTDSGRTMFWCHAGSYPSAFNYPDHDYRMCMHFLAGDAAVSATLAPRMDPGRWYHLAQSWGPEGFRAYLDGELVFQDMRQRTGVSPNANNPTRMALPYLYLGNAGRQAAEPVLGGAAYDDFAVFRRQLSDAEIFRLAREPQLLHGLLTETPAASGIRAASDVLSGGDEAPALPLSRDQQAMVALAGSLYVAGGYHNSGTGEADGYVNDLLRWSPGESSWRRLSELQLPRVCHAAAAAGNSIYLMGGSTEAGGTHPYSDLDDVARYDLDSGCWTQCAPMPTPRNFLCAVALAGKIYAIGGQSPGYAQGAFECYDPARDAWTGLVPLPTPRYGAAAATVGGKIYVFGGAGGDMRSGAAGQRRNLYFNTLEIYDPASGSWSRGADMPTPRAGAVIGVLDGRIYVMGGFDDKSGYGRGQRNLTGNAPGPGEMAVLNVVESYDPASNSWRRERPLRQPSNRGGAAVLGDAIYLVGGCTIDGNTYDRVEVYRPQPGRPVGHQ